MAEHFTLNQALATIHAATECTAKYMPGMQIGKLRRLRHVHYDQPRWWLTDYFQAFQVDPEEVVRTIQNFPSDSHLLGVITSDTDAALSSYAALGYKSLSTEFIEPLMAKQLTEVKHNERRQGNGDYPVERVTTERQRRFFNSNIPSHDPHGQMQPEELEDPHFTYYYVEQDGLCVCTGKAIQAFPAAVVVEPLETQPSYRRRGIATALMHRLHSDAREKGAMECVIMASAQGKLLYDTLGYEILGYHQEFVRNDCKRGNGQ